MSRRVRKESNQIRNWAIGFGMGCGVTYLLDLDRGRRRRAVLRDKAVHAFHSAGDTTDKSIRDIGNRVKGTAAELWSAVKRKPVWDEVLVERVRARMGRVVSHPNAVQVTVRSGRVTLTGPILEHEADRLIGVVSNMRGVSDVENHLVRHKHAENVPGLQGGRQLGGPRPELMQEYWAPSTRVLAGAFALAAIVGGLRRPRGGLPIAAIGSGLLLRSLVNRPVRHALGLAEGRRGIEFQKTIEVHAPVERVYEMWSKPENFPRFMSHVKEVKKTDNAYHWTVRGPAGVSVSWNAVITETVPNRIVSWESLPGALLRNAGTARFDATEGGATRVHLRMSYNPVGGAIAHALAALFGTDPKRVMDDDLARFKSLFEQGKTTVHGEKITREQIGA